MDNLLLMFVVAGFLAVVLLIEGGYRLWQANRSAEARRLQRRLQALSAGGHSKESDLLKKRLLAESAGLERLLLRVPRVGLMDRMLLQSGRKTTVASLAGWTLCAAFAGWLAWLVLGTPWWTAPFFVGGAGSLPFLLVLRSRRARLRQIEEQLPEAMDLMSRAMRAGHAFLSALQMAGSESPEPIAREFRIAAEEVNYGVAMQEALINLAVRVPVTDLRFFVVAVAVQRETGGNLAELLDKTASLMRARFKLLGTIRVLSSEGRLSGWILTILPFALLTIISLINPKFMSILWKDPAGLIAVYAGITLMVIGILWMWRIVKMRV
ncbi:MAG TPA: type II secretion system F family protein [Burkholderiales bacterium]|nr:type II secretion system F family protein [Burkholderiales bacterium]